MLVPLLWACSGESKPSNGRSNKDGVFVPDARPFDTPAPGTPGAERQITGLFLTPRDTKVMKASLGPKSASLFQPSDGKSVVVFDTQAGKATNLGAGIVVAPAFNNGRMLYAGEGEAWLVDLATMQKRSLGPANVAFFVDDNHAALVSAQNRTAVLDLTTGERQIASSLSDTVISDQETGTLGGPLKRRQIQGRYVLRYAVDADKLYALKCRATASPEAELCGLRFREEYVVEANEGRVIYQFRALQALPAGKGEFMIATSPVCDDGSGRLIWCEEVLARMEAGSKPGDIKYARGSTNIFVVDVASGKARFIATVAYNPPTNIRPFNWPLSADSNYVVWTEQYCGQTRGKTRIYDRRSGRIRELDATLWVRMAVGLLGAGEFGSKALIDPATLQYRTVLPDNLGDTAWSPDYRYAAVGQNLGHGGLCG